MKGQIKIPLLLKNPPTDFHLFITLHIYIVDILSLVNQVSIQLLIVLNSNFTTLTNIISFCAHAYLTSLSWLHKSEMQII